MTRNDQPTGAQKIGDLILPFVFGPIPAARADIRPPLTGQLPFSTFIYADSAGCWKFLAAGIAGLGKNPTIVHTPLDAIAMLQNSSTAVDAAFVSLQDVDFDISTFFDLLRNEYPRVRRIAFAQHESRSDGSPLVDTCRHDMILWDPWDRTGFAEILKDALDCRVRRTRSSWSDLELFESFQGTDVKAIAEIVRRYRYRIVRLVLDVTRDARDTEDVVQEIYLDIVRCLPYFGAICSPGHWIDRISCKAIRAFFYSGLRETSKAVETFVDGSPAWSSI